MVFFDFYIFNNVLLCLVSIVFQTRKCIISGFKILYLDQNVFWINPGQSIALNSKTRVPSFL